MNTREKILEVSLDMFAKQGYTAVSIRDICKQVGIKESSVYYHFKNKQSIFDEFINKFTEIANGMIIQLENGLTDGEGSFSDSFNSVANVFFEKYLMDDFCNKVIRVMLTEENKTAFREAAYKHIQLFFMEMGCYLFPIKMGTLLSKMTANVEK